MLKPKYRKNLRGFKEYEPISDHDGNCIHITESSLATEPAIRLFSLGETSKDGHMHLTIPQVKQLIGLLQIAMDNHYQT